MMALRNRSRSRKLAVLAVTLAVALTMIAGNIGSGTAGPPAQGPGIVEGMTASNLVLNYQGRLLDPATGNPKPNGSYAMSFNIYDVEALGSPLWTENRSVSLTGGLFSTLLGDVSPTPLPLAIFDGRALWLGVTVGADPEATPRMRLAYTPYALHAEDAVQAGNASLLGGQPPSAFAVAGHTHTGATIVDGSVALADLGSNSVDGSKVVDGSLALTDLAPNSVDSSKIVNGSVALADLGSNSVDGSKIVDGSIGDADVSDRTVALSFPAHALNHAPGTVITDFGSGLRWQANYPEGAYLMVRRPLDWDGVSDVTMHLWLFSMTGNAGYVQFFIRPRSYVSGNTFGDTSSIDAARSYVSVAYTIIDQTVTIPAFRLAGDLWVITMQRGGTQETYPDDVILLSVALHYTAVR